MPQKPHEVSAQPKSKDKNNRSQWTTANGNFFDEAIEDSINVTKDGVICYLLEDYIVSKDEIKNN